jgi:FixJ family two-component response regulator
MAEDPYSLASRESSIGSFFAEGPRWTLHAQMAKVFIVDDDILVVNALGRALRTEGYAVEAPVSAQQLFENLEHDEPACVLLDLLLPGVNGLEIQQRLKGDPALPIIFLTGHATIAASVEAMKQGAFDFLLKPVDITTLLDVVGRALARSASVLDRRHQRESTWHLFSRLTSREREVAKLVADGLLNRQIGEALGITEKTVKIHRGRLMQKLMIRSVPQLVRLLERIADDPK